ncbi:hypothetical protein BC936DRAFT_138008 [Jimgerdemannia flammicorona]|uniref:Replication protein A OB domain-containing protein n=1 Tax=Jimgerdemannia flammicorona TaxID=994334 RepID=A0A433DIN7_9FUNG|nr:hypothetical protein BC936DRAFT_138008 [Jimgerdemannia flammicorona]
MPSKLSGQFVKEFCTNSDGGAQLPVLQILIIKTNPDKCSILAISNGVHYMHAGSHMLVEDSPNAIVCIKKYNRIVIDGSLFFIIDEYEHLENPDAMINNPVYFRGDRSEPIQLNGLLSIGFVADFLGGAELCPDIVLRVEEIEHVALNGTSRYTDIPVDANTVCKVADGSRTMFAISQENLDITLGDVIRIHGYSRLIVKNQPRWLEIHTFEIIETQGSKKRPSDDEADSQNKRQKITPIRDLVKYSSGITVHVLVISRSPFARDGFHATIHDSDQEIIKLRIFGKNARKDFEKLVPGSCYYITGARLVCKSGQWQLTYSFVPIRDIREGRSVDILGVVVDVGKVGDVIASGHMTILHKIKIVDVSCHAISVTFWGQQAINLAVTDGAILAISNADPRIYHARYELYILDNSWVEQGLRTSESDALQQWYTIQERKKVCYQEVMAVTLLQMLLETPIVQGETVYSAVECTIAATSRTDVVHISDGQCSIDMFMAEDIVATLGQLEAHRYRITCTAKAVVERGGMVVQYSVTLVNRTLE